MREPPVKMDGASSSPPDLETLFNQLKLQTHPSRHAALTVLFDELSALTSAEFVLVEDALSTALTEALYGANQQLQQQLLLQLQQRSTAGESSSSDPSRAIHMPPPQQQQQAQVPPLTTYGRFIQEAIEYSQSGFPDLGDAVANTVFVAVGNDAQTSSIPHKDAASMGVTILSILNCKTAWVCTFRAVQMFSRLDKSAAAKLMNIWGFDNVLGPCKLYKKDLIRAACAEFLQRTWKTIESASGEQKNVAIQLSGRYGRQLMAIGLKFGTLNPWILEKSENLSSRRNIWGLDQGLLMSCGHGSFRVDLMDDKQKVGTAMFGCIEHDGKNGGGSLEIDAPRRALQLYDLFSGKPRRAEKIILEKAVIFRVPALTANLSRASSDSDFDE